MERQYPFCPKHKDQTFRASYTTVLIAIVGFLVISIFAYLYASRAFPLVVIGGNNKFHIQERILTDEEAFHRFLTTYKKGYSSMEEYNERFSVFKENYDRILKHNKDSQQMHTLKLNEFADLTSEEFIQSIGSTEEVTQGEFSMFQGSEYAFVPEEWDWSTQGKVSQIKKHIQACGGSWAFSAIGAIESSYMIKHSKQVELSEQQLLDCTFEVHMNKERECDYGTVYNAFYYAHQHCLLTRKEYPYLGYVNNCSANSDIGVKVSKMYAIPANNSELLKEAVARQPVSVLIDAMGLQFYGEGIIKSSCGSDPHHAVLVVGYGATSPPERTPFWIIKNSWGVDWGEKGYMRILREESSDTTGVCGIHAKVSLFPEVY